MMSSLKEEYATIEELGADVIAVSADTADSHAAFAGSLGGCPFPLASDTDLEVAARYDAVDETGRRAVRAVYVLDADRTIVHKIPWYQPGNPGQFMEIFQALGLE
jgi:peroxiredoxin